MYTSTFVAQLLEPSNQAMSGPPSGMVSTWPWRAAFSCFPLSLRRFSLSLDIARRPERRSHFPYPQSWRLLFLVNGAFSCFYSGRGKSWTIVWMNLSMCCLNILLDYLLIFGNWGLPRMGIRGAAMATVASSGTIMVAYALFCSKKNNAQFQTRSS